MPGWLANIWTDPTAHPLNAYKGICLDGLPIFKLIPPTQWPTDPDYTMKLEFVLKRSWVAYILGEEIIEVEFY